MEQKWHRLNKLHLDEPLFWEFSDPFHRDYWYVFSEVIEAIGRISATLIVDDEDNTPSPDDEDLIMISNNHLCVAKLPLEIVIFGEEE